MALQPLPASPCYQLPTQLALNALNSFSLIDLFDDALANLLCLETYTHGTSPRNYFGILARGADPRLGGREDMGEGGFDRSREHVRPSTEEWNSRGKFYVMTDNMTMTASGVGMIDVPLARVLKKTAPRGYALICTAGECTQPQTDCLWKFSGIVSAFALSTFSPTLKFRFSPENTAGRFQRDPTHNEGNIASFTEQPIASDHIGLYGTLAHALDGNLIDRIQNDPWRFAEGLVELVLVVALAILVVATLATSSTAATVLAALLTYETAICIGRFVVPLLFGLIAELPTPTPEAQPQSAAV